MVSIRLQKWLAAWLKRKAKSGQSQADLIEAALIGHYGLKPRGKKGDN
jgi:hypothetical protein